MASINWTMLNSHLLPILLPKEKILLSVPSISLILIPSTITTSTSSSTTTILNTLKLTSKGKIHISNQRLIFISDLAKLIPTSSTTSISSQVLPNSIEIETLSIPYSALLSQKFIQPWFSATYLEGLILPHSKGNFDSTEPHTIKLSFLESGGYQVLEIIESIKIKLVTSNFNKKNNLNSGGEDLPVYTPPPGSSTGVEIGTLVDTDAIAGISREEIDGFVVGEAENERLVERSRNINERTSTIISSSNHTDRPPGYEP